MRQKKRKSKLTNLSTGLNPSSSRDLLRSDKSTYFYKKSFILLSASALLWLISCVTDLILNNNVYAESVTSEVSDYASISFSISNSEKGELDSGEGDSAVSAVVTPGVVSYIDNVINVTTKNIDKFYVTVQAASDNSTKLTGITNKATINPVGSNKMPADFDDNTWGYALSSNVDSSDSSLTYNSLPAYSTVTAPQYTSSSDLADGDYNLKLVFAARINANNPADHYTTKAMVSVVADAKSIATLGNITKMSQLTAAYCKSLPTPAADAPLNEVPTGQLTNDEDGNKYWISKLADGNCWMTQNMLYNSNASNDSSNDKLVDQEGNVFDIGSRTVSGDPLATEVFPTETTYNAHYQVGGYFRYFSTDNYAETYCSISNSNWQVPIAAGSISNDAANGSFAKLFSIYGITNDEAGVAAIQAPPLFFVRGGLESQSSNDSIPVGDAGYYLPMLDKPSQARPMALTTLYGLIFDHAYVDTNDSLYTSINTYTGGAGMSLRCVTIAE